ncbi:ACT domain-containing protein, partial [Marivivens sp.]|uniref:ACT domain-containing protein n=1 Tax=Marivivens sp. TaxID=1978374 RepID=UPI00345BEAC4
MFGLEFFKDLAHATVVVLFDSGASQSFTLELVGHDKPGIVRDISSALAKRHINVERLSTELVS